MADFVLIGASAGLTIVISRHVDVNSRLPSFKLALGVALALFSLTILEAVPSSWMFVLAHDGDGGSGKYLTMTVAYRYLLWMLSLLILVVLPSAAGARLVQSLERRSVRDPDEQKDHTTHWILRYIGCGLRLLLAVPSIFIRILFRRCRSKFKSRRNAEPVLVLSSSVTEGGSRHGPRIPSSPSVRSVESKWRSFTIGGICGVTTVVMVFWSLGSLMIQSPSGNLLPTMVTWLCSMGLLLSSVLNGFGSVSLPHSCLVGLYLEPIGPETIAKAEVERQKASSALADKRNELTLTLSSSASSSTDLASMKRRTWGGSSSNTRNYGDEEMQRRQKVQRDIDFLQSLVDELKEDVADMRHARILAEQARTPTGKIRFYLGFVFSLVLLIRLGTSFASIWHPSDTATTLRRTDPITTALLWLSGHHLVSVDYNALSQFVSLLLTACLSMSQVRMFLRTMSAIHRRLANFYRKCYCKSQKQGQNVSPEGSQQLYADLLATLMGCYFVSCIVMTKRILPLDYSVSFSRAMGGNEFVVQSSVANAAFCASAVVSAVVLGMLFGIQRQNTKRHVSDDTIGSLDVC